ncbi:MAG: hypothetical protein KBD04_07250 [Proteobacteria bacterium]|nr:hypothetical protein [Pseudomonadota bacterium]
MTLDEIKKFYKNSYNFEKTTGMSHTNWVNWHAKGYVPIQSQIRLFRASNGKLKVDFDKAGMRWEK